MRRACAHPARDPAGRLRAEGPRAPLLRGEDPRSARPGAARRAALLDRRPGAISDADALGVTPLIRRDAVGFIAGQTRSPHVPRLRRGQAIRFPSAATASASEPRRVRCGVLPNHVCGAAQDGKLRGRAPADAPDGPTAADAAYDRCSGCSKLEPPPSRASSNPGRIPFVNSVPQTHTRLENLRLYAPSLGQLRDLLVG